MFDIISTPGLSVLLQVIMIDLVLAGDNAIVIGLAAAGLAAEQRHQGDPARHRRGHRAAHRVRRPSRRSCCSIVGLLLAGGILLLWVCWKMWRELRASPAASACERRSARGSRRRAEWHAPALAAKDVAAGGTGRSSSRTCRCRSTTCWPWQARRASIPIVLVFGLRVVGRDDGRSRELRRAAAQAPPMDHLCRSRDHSLRGVEHDLSRDRGAASAHRCGDELIRCARRRCDRARRRGG